jgi:hypothetical protein
VDNVPRGCLPGRLGDFLASIGAKFKAAFVSIRNALSPSCESAHAKSPSPASAKVVGDGGGPNVKQEFPAVAKYISGAGDFLVLNRALRAGGELTPDQATWANAISTELRDAPTNMRHEGESYRGFRMEADVLREAIETKTFSEQGFLSTTTYMGTAVSFAKAAQGNRVPVLLVIKSNDQGIDVSKVPNQTLEGDESEVLFDRNCRFNILGASSPTKSAPWHELLVEIMPRGA